jgi:integrase
MTDKGKENDMRYPYTLYKVKSKLGIMWHARFWDETLQKYAHSRTTGILAEGKKENRREAEDAAKKLYQDFITQRNEAETIGNVQVTRSKPVIKTVANTPLVEYLSDFWTAESEYAKFKRDVKLDPLTPEYIKNNFNDVRRHVQPFEGFEGVTVGSLSKATLKKWLIWLAGRRKTRTKKDGTIIDEGQITGRRANTIIQSVRVAVRWAVDNEEIENDPFHKLGEVTEVNKEKGVLTFEERKILTELPVTDKNYKQRLMMLLGSFCGLRRGEMRGLLWGDIANGLINVQHNYINGEGIKKPKCNSVRNVPITSVVQNLLDFARKEQEAQDIKNKRPVNTSPERYVFESPKFIGKPLSNNFFRDRMEIELLNLGINTTQQEERFLSCHSLRHTFVTLAQLSGIPDVEIRAMTGQKSASVMNRYSHVPQVINYDEARRKLETQIVFKPKAA